MYTQEDNDFWKSFAESIQAEFVPLEYWHSPKAVKYYRNIKIVFEGFFHSTASGMYSFERFYTRVCSNFTSPYEPVFILSEKNWLKALKQFISLNGFSTGDRNFDKRFIVYTREKILIDKVFDDQEIRSLILQLQNVQLKIGNKDGITGDEIPRPGFELSYHSKGRRIDPAQLHIVDALFEKLIDRLYTLHIIKT